MRATLGLCIFCNFLFRQDLGILKGWPALCVLGKATHGKAFKQCLSPWIVRLLSLLILATVSSLCWPACTFLVTSCTLFKGVSIQVVCAAACWASPHMFARFDRFEVIVPTLAQSVLGRGSSQNRAPSLWSTNGDICLLYRHVWQSRSQSFFHSETQNWCYEREVKVIDITLLL